MTAVVIRGTPYPVVLPKLRDPRLHLAATITSLQVIGQVGFHFRLSIAQILISLGTAGVLEVAIAARRQHVIMWPASALLTANGVAFVLRVPGTAHGDWWSLRGWWIYAATSGLSLLSKYVIAWKGEHVFNPSNIGLVVCFLALGRTRADPLDFWWGPMSVWLVLALCVILAGGFTILGRLGLLRIALGFWASFAAGIAVLAVTGHAMLARWHLGPITGFHFWWVLVTSPEVLVFLFFMITDPKTAPRSPSARLVYAVALGLLGALMIAPTTSEFASKVALLGSLAVVCVAMRLLRPLQLPLDRRLVVLAAPVVVAAYAATITLAGTTTAAAGFRAVPSGTLPPISILHSSGVQTQLDRHTAELIAHDLLASVHVSAVTTLSLKLAPGGDQSPPFAVAETGGHTYTLDQAGNHWRVRGVPAAPTVPVKLPTAPAPGPLRLTDVAPSVGLDFRQESFRFGVTNDYRAMMGGGLCWLDYDGDGRLDLFVVNSYASSDAARFEAQGGLPTSQLFRNVHGRFVNVTSQSGAGLAVQGDGCVAGDLNGDGRPDLVVTTATGLELLWNDGDGRFTEGARAAGLTASGWYTGAAIADVNGDGRPDVFVAGYSDPNQPVPGSLAGFPTNFAGVRDLLYLNEGTGSDGRPSFREAGIQAGLEAAQPRHGLGATFLDYNHDGRPDLYVADDEDPNQLYENVRYPGGAKADPAGLGFRFEERAAAVDVADPYAGMGIATSDGGLFVTNSRNEPSAAYHASRSRFSSDRNSFIPALGTGFAGWGVTWADLTNAGKPDLVLSAGAIPVTSLAGDAEPVRVLGPRADGGYGDLTRILSGGLSVNGRGAAAADVNNDGRMQIAVNTIGGRLALLRPSGTSGHWLDVSLTRFVPGAVVTVVLADGRRLVHTVQAGSSYLSSEDPRVHFGLGTVKSVTQIVVRVPGGGVTRLDGVPADRVVSVLAPAVRPAATPTPRSFALSSCTPSLHGESVARAWTRTAVTALRLSGLSEPVQARDLFHLSAAMWDAWAAYTPHGRQYFGAVRASANDAQAARETAISYAAYRLLVWRLAYGANLDRTYAVLTRRLRSLCYTPDYSTTSGGTPAAIGNEIGAAAIAFGRRDGSLEALHYVDAGYQPQNGPLVVAQPGSTVHDATFWQPLALAEVAAHGAGSVPAAIQTFAGAQWGGVAGLGPVSVPTVPQVGLPSSNRYRQAAVAAIRATAGARAAPSGEASPLGWNELVLTLPERGSQAARLARDLRVSFTLNGALADAAISVWGAKRTSQAPRPISMIRYLAFQGQSSDPAAAGYAADGLPLVAGLVELATSGPNKGHVLVRSGGRWVLGSAWRPRGPTPDSPGGVSEASAFASAASEALVAATGRSFATRAERLGKSGLARGIDVPVDVSAGRSAGLAAARIALAAAQRYVG